MIPTMALEEWYHEKPWQDLAKVEQDLLICRCIVAIYQDDFLASQLAFRGGTAMHKLYYHPQPRYSEDIDLVQIYPGPIKPILQRLGQVLAFMPDKVVKQKHHSNSMLLKPNSDGPNNCNCPSPSTAATLSTPWSNCSKNTRMAP